MNLLYTTQILLVHVLQIFLISFFLIDSPVSQAPVNCVENLNFVEIPNGFRKCLKGPERLFYEEEDKTSSKSRATVPFKRRFHALIYLQTWNLCSELFALNLYSENLMSMISTVCF